MTEPLCRNTSWTVILYEQLSSLAPQFLLGTLTGALLGFSAGFVTAGTLLLAYLGWRRIRPSSAIKSDHAKTTTGRAWLSGGHSPLHYMALLGFTAYWTLPLDRWLPLAQVLLERPTVDYFALYSFAQLLLWAVKRWVKSSAVYASAPPPTEATASPEKQGQQVIKKKKKQ